MPSSPRDNGVTSEAGRTSPLRDLGAPPGPGLPRRS
jgi:hypothetical protein